MNILAVGDVVGTVGCEFFRSKLPTFKKLKAIDLVIVNGENSADGNGITPTSADFLFKSGADVITTGNHSFRRKESYSLYEENDFVIRPANFPENTTPGKGLSIIDMGRTQVAVINLMGTAFLEPLACPFETIDKQIEKAKEMGAKIIIVDLHAEATGEKRALGYYVDGRVSALFGTHTHVQTADECILPKGTGYITDVGMTGTINSVLGVKTDIIIKKFKEKLPIRFELENGECKMDCILFEVDNVTGKTKSFERFELL